MQALAVAVVLLASVFGLIGVGASVASAAETITVSSTAGTLGDAIRTSAMH